MVWRRLPAAGRGRGGTAWSLSSPSLGPAAGADAAGAHGDAAGFLSCELAANLPDHTPPQKQEFGLPDNSCNPGWKPRSTPAPQPLFPSWGGRGA